jgi:hypothetical protein
VIPSKRKYYIKFNDEEIKELRKYLALMEMECHALDKQLHSSHDKTMRVLIGAKDQISCNHRQFLYLLHILKFFLVKEFKSAIPNKIEINKLRNYLTVLAQEDLRTSKKIMKLMGDVI